jgi:hypothetical protein
MGLKVLTGQLGASAFLSDVDARDRDAWRIVGSIVAGLLTWLLVSIAAGVALLVAYTYGIGAAQRGLQAMLSAISGLLSGDVRDVQTALFVLVMAAGSNVAGFFAGVAVVAPVMRHRFKDYLTHAPAIRWRLVLAGMALCAVMMSPLVTAERLMDPNAPLIPVLSLSHDWLVRLGYAAAAICLLVPAAAAEEIFFRGWLLRQTSAFLKHPLGLILINGVVFSAAHLDFSPDAFLIRTMMGAGFAYMTLRLGGIEFSTGAHAANNILIVLFIEPLSLKTPISSGFSALTLFEMAALSVGAIAITELVVRVPALRRWTRVRDEDLSQPTAGVAETFA